MNAINRQKFLAELAKLLSFMYEEDRRYALDMYERMFNIAGEDEQWLIQNLMSPTRQAVIIARSYDAKERSLTVSAHWKEEDGYEETDEYEIVGSNETDPVNNKISDECPVGKALIGHMVGDIVTVDVGYGKTSYEILKVKANI